MEISTGLMTHVHSTLDKRKCFLRFKCLAGKIKKMLQSVVSNQSQAINMQQASIHARLGHVLMWKEQLLSRCLGGPSCWDEALPASCHWSLASVGLGPLPTEGAMRLPSENKPLALRHPNHRAGLKWWWSLVTRGSTEVRVDRRLELNGSKNKGKV